MSRLLHRVVARPGVYDLVQSVAGAAAVRRRLASALASATARSAGLRVLDVGGGTGGWRGLWPPDARYTCLDLDLQKLQGFRLRHPGGRAVCADASALPLPDACADAVACTLVTHHLTDAQLGRVLGECARVLRPGGVFAFADAVWEPARWPGRLLWQWDRGSFPKTEAALREAIARHFTIRHWERFAVLHAYALCVAGPLL